MFRSNRFVQHFDVGCGRLCYFIIVLLAVLAILTPVALAQGTGYWHTSGSRILDSNNQVVRIAGINWYGFETTDQIAHGLWAQDYHTILTTIKNNGYNVIRMPYSNQMVETPIVPSNLAFTGSAGNINTDLRGLTALQVMDKIITTAGAIGLRVILDNHRSEAGNSAEQNGLWFTTAYPESAWINDWVTMTNRYSSFRDPSGNPIVIGMDLRNEPHLNVSGQATGACWQGDTATAGCVATNPNNWPAAATRAGNAVLAANSSLLVIVEGAECYNGDCDWWGGNLEGVATNPVTLSVANRLVYSPHDYGPNLFRQTWFSGTTTFASLSAVWNKFWGYISTNGTAPIWVGEFGTTNTASDIQSAVAGSQGQWFQSLVSFLQNSPDLSWTYWALNGEDSFSLLSGQYDPVPLSALKQSMLAGIQFPLTGGGGLACPPPSSPPMNFQATAVSSTQINLSWTAVPPPAPGCTVTYSIFRSTTSGFTPGPANQVASGLTTTSFANTGLTPSTNYLFVIEAVDITATTQPSSQINGNTQAGSGTCTAVPPVPGGLTATATSSSQINLSWGAVAPPANCSVTYSVFRSTTSGFIPSAANQVASGLTTTSFSNTGLTASTAYFLIVEALDAAGPSAPSAQATATTQPSPTPDFSLSASPATLSVAQGASGTSTITIARLNGFASTVAFTASGLPTGVTATFVPQTTTTTGTSSVLTLAASTTATLGGPVTVTITGTGGGLTRTTTIALTVTAVATPDFSLSASPGTLSVPQGASGNSTITITRLNGFASTVAFTATGLPTGVTATFVPQTTTTTGTSSVLTLAASATATVGGPVTVTINGTGGGLTRTTTVGLTVTTAGGGTGGVTVTPVVTTSSPWFNEEQFRMTNTGAITAMSLTIVVQRTTGISFNGQYNTVGSSITQGNASTATTVTYTYTLNAGQSLSPGNYTFAAQTSGNGTAHPTAGDTFTVTYTTGGANFTQTGHF